MIDQLIESKFDARKRKVSQKAIKLNRPPSSKTSELYYFKQLRKMVNFLNGIIRETLVPQISSITKSAEAMHPSADRMDEYVDEIEAAINSIIDQYYSLYTDTMIATMAINAAERIEAINRRYYYKITEKIMFYEKFSQKKVLSVSVGHESWLETEIKAFVKTNAGLIKSIPEDQLKRVEGIVMRGAQKGTLAKDMTTEIKNAFNISHNKAKLIARDQVSKFNGMLNKNRQQSVGVKEYVWSTSGDERVRDTHEANNGQIFSWNDPPATGHPGEDINCRCVAIPLCRPE